MSCHHVNYWRTVERCERCDRIHFYCTHCGDQLDLCGPVADRGLLGMPDVAAIDVLELMEGGGE